VCTSTCKFALALKTRVNTPVSGFAGSELRKAAEEAVPALGCPGIGRTGMSVFFFHPTLHISKCSRRTVQRRPSWWF
jgi:hypothetical protein